MTGDRLSWYLPADELLEHAQRVASATAPAQELTHEHINGDDEFHRRNAPRTGAAPHAGQILVDGHLSAFSLFKGRSPSRQQRANGRFYTTVPIR